MKNVELRLSLIKSGALLALFVFFIYAFAVGDSGGIGGTIGSLISAVTYIIALAIALVICVFIMFGIYFGILYLYNPEVSKKTYEEFKGLSTNVATKLPLSAKCCSSHQDDSPVESPVNNELATIESKQAALAGEISTVATSLEGIQKALTTVQNSLGALEEELTTIKEQTASLDEAVQSKADGSAIEDATSSLRNELESIKGTTQPLEAKIASLEQNLAEFTRGDNEETPPVEELIENAVKPLQTKIDSISKEVEALGTTAAETSEEKEEEHRILTYFTKKGDQKKFIASVQKAVDQGMTYAQIDDFLVENLPKDLVAIATDHPSLTKDYIRTIRQK